MFFYKFCSKCKKRNHKKRTHCVRCDDQLPNAPRFGINVFVITLGIIILLSSGTVFASKSYFNNKAEKSQPNTQVQGVETKKDKVKPTTDKKPTEEEVKSEPAQETPAKEENAIVPQPTPTSATEPVFSSPVVPIITTPVPEPEVKTCNASEKENLLAWYDEKISAENDRYTQEVAAIKADFSRRGMWCQNSGLCQATVDQATATHNHNINNIGYWLQSSLSNINCSN